VVPSRRRSSRRALIVLVCVAALVAAGCEGGASEERPEAGRAEEATVEWVVDGDTLRLAGGKQVRLLQIDAPEGGKDCYGDDATRELIRLTPKGTRVRLERDPGLDDTDQYDRLLRYVFVGRENVNVELVERGAVSPYYFRNDRGRYARELDDAVANAMKAERGYWRVCPEAELETGLGSVTGPASTQQR
jgi:micrococcal nuclease